MCGTAHKGNADLGGIGKGFLALVTCDGGAIFFRALYILVKQKIFYYHAKGREFPKARASLAKKIQILGKTILIR